MLKLVVTIPFSRYAIGQSITDPAEIEAAQKSNPAHVVRVNAQEPAQDPEPEPLEAPQPPIN